MTENNSTINYYFHPIKVSLLLAVPILMSLIIWLLAIGEKSIFIIVFITLYLLITVLLTIRMIKLFRHMVSGKPVLTLTKDALIDNRSKIVIDWKDISDITMRGGKSNYISIKLYNSEKYISKINNPLLQRMYRFNSKIFHGTFTIGVDLLKGNSWGILKTVQQSKIESKTASI